MGAGKNPPTTWMARGNWGDTRNNFDIMGGAIKADRDCAATNKLGSTPCTGGAERTRVHALGVGEGEGRGGVDSTLRHPCRVAATNTARCTAPCSVSKAATPLMRHAARRCMCLTRGPPSLRASCACVCTPGTYVTGVCSPCGCSGAGRNESGACSHTFVTTTKATMTTTTTTTKVTTTTATTKTATTASTTTATQTTTTTTTATTTVTTTTTTTTIDYCRPKELEGEDQAQGNSMFACVSIPEPEGNAVVNMAYSTDGTATIDIPARANNHKADGKFGASEWVGVTPAVGRFTNAYFDFTAEPAGGLGHLHVLNDWVYNPDREVRPDCYNLFIAFTGDGQQKWEFRVYGSGRVSSVARALCFCHAEAGCPNTVYCYSSTVTPSLGCRHPQRRVLRR